MSVAGIACSSAFAQQKPTPVIGILGSGSSGAFASPMDALRQGLRDSGYVEGRNLAIEFRWAEGNY